MAENVCENKMPELVGNPALKIKLPALVELVMEIVVSEDPSPFAVRVPLIRIDESDQGTTVTRPSTLEIER